MEWETQKRFRGDSFTRRGTLCVLFVLLLVLVSCKPSKPADKVGRGDLLFVALPYDYHSENDAEAAAIRTSVASLRKEGCLITDTLNLIHVAILDVVDDSLFVVDATLRRGVARYPFADFVQDFTLRDGTLPTFFVCRLNDTSEVERFIANACRFVGQPYDTAFASDNGAMYCTELVRESYVTAKGDTLFAQGPIDCTAPYGGVPPYWRRMFDESGVSSMEGSTGTWPNTLIHAPCLHRIDVALPLPQPAEGDRFALQKDTLIRGLGPKVISRVIPHDITLLDAYYYSFATADGTVESNAVYTFLNHDTDHPSCYGIFAEDSLEKVFASAERYRTPVDADVERGEVEPTIQELVGYWVYVQPLGDTYVFDNVWDFIPAMHLLPDRVEFLTMDGVCMQDVMEFHRFEDGTFELRLDGERPDMFSGRFVPVDTVHRVYRMADATYRTYIAPAVKVGEPSFEVVEYACRIPEILDSYFPLVENEKEKE